MRRTVRNAAPLRAEATVRIGLLALCVAASTLMASGQAGGTAARRQTVLLPWPSTMSQPMGTALHGTSWRVAKVTDHGRVVRVGGDPVVLFDFGDGIGENVLVVFDGCQSWQGTFAFSSGSLIGMGRPSFAPCVANPSAQLVQAVLAGSSGVRPATVVSATKRLVVSSGDRRVELEHSGGNSLSGTGWVPQQWTNGTLGSMPFVSFGTTRFASDDGCNSFHGTFVVAGSRLVVASTISTAMACLNMPDDPYVGTPPHDETTLVRKGNVLVLTLNGRSTRYRQVPALERPLLVTPAPDATAAPASAAVVGSWRIQALDGGRRMRAGVAGTIEFRSDGTFSGSTPCETLSGRWSQAALTMATTIDGLIRVPVACDTALSADNHLLGDVLASGRLAVGRGDVRLQLAPAGTDPATTGVVLAKV